MHPVLVVSLLCSRFLAVGAFNFPFEGIQLKDEDINNNLDLQFASTSSPGPNASPGSCKSFPGDANWPNEEQWTALNDTLGGSLIKTVPPGSSCYLSQPNYDATQCNAISTAFAQLQFQLDNPPTVLSRWLGADTCLPTTNASGTCTLGGYPVYVVNATNVKEIQLAVNFARNTNVRLIIKNTGHDFIGRSLGAGSLSVWTHHLKSFEYLPTFTIGQYTGQAVRVGTGVQSYELFNYMEQFNITTIAPQDISVGTFGGYMQGGGHSWLGSKYGLMADQVLSLQVVTADGRFVTADPETNQDLFFALRGGGGGNFGIVTSAVIKAYPSISMSSVPIQFTTASTQDTPGLSSEIFWNATRAYFADLPRICAASGFGYNFIFVTPPSNSSKVATYRLTTTYYFPGRTADEASAIVAPIIARLNSIGANITSPTPTYYSTYGSMYAGRNITGTAGAGGRMISRLWPQANFQDETLLDNSMTAIRAFVEEGGYTFHSVAYTPTTEIAGYPGNTSAVNPAFRKSIMHVTGFDSLSGVGNATAQLERYKLLNSYAQRLRDATPGSGAYMNEADVQEPEWQQAFFGSNYPRLLEIKQKVDPWSVFYAVHAVGSEGWEVKSDNGLPTENGKLCQTGQSS